MAKEKRKPPPKRTALFLVNLEELIPSETDKDGKITKSSPMAFALFWTPGQPANKKDVDYHRKHAANELRYNLLMAEREGPAILGVYLQIYRHIGIGRRRATRGWLVNSQYKPATAREVAAMIHVPDSKLVGRAIRVLTKIGMLQAFPLPNLQRLDEMDRQSYPPELTGHALAVTSDDDGNDDGNDGLFPELTEPTEDGDKGAFDPAKARGATTDPRVQSNAGTAGSGGETPPEEPPGFEPGSNRGAKGLTLDDRRTDDRPADGRDGEPSAASPPSALGDGINEQNKKPATAPTDNTPAAARRAADALTGEQPTTPPVPDDATLQTPHEPPADAAAANEPQGDSDHATPPSGSQGTSAELPTEADAAQGAALPSENIDWHAEGAAQRVFDILYPDRQTIVEQSRIWNAQGKGHAQTPDEFQAREIGSFRASFIRELPGLTQVAAMRLLARADTLAAETHRKKPKSTRGRLWTNNFRQAARTIRQEGSGPP